MQLESKYPKPCRKEFARLEKEDPALLIEWVKSGELEPCDLTFAAENLGRIPSALPVLLDLLKHDSAVVREGALIGLYMIKEAIDCLIGDLAESDESPGVRHVAKEIFG